MTILYSQCWEDPQMLAEGLGITPADDVLSIASAGDNSLALLLDRPKHLTVVDVNPAQLYLLELKMAATDLSYDQFVAFLGARPSADRLDMYFSLRGSLSPQARNYWDREQSAVRLGVIHCGRLERYLATFRNWVLPLIHRRPLIERLLGAIDLAEQRRIYEGLWDCIRWRLLFRVFFSQAVMSRCGRRPEWFAQVTMPDIGRILLERTRLGLTCVPTFDNYFLEYIFTGGFRDLDLTAPYMRRSNFDTLKQGVKTLTLTCCGLTSLLSQSEAGTYSAFNLSDVFEYMSPPDAEQLWGELMRTARPGARFVYRTLFVARQPPPQLAGRLRLLPISLSATARDRTFFYDCLIALQSREAAP